MIGLRSRGLICGISSWPAALLSVDDQGQEEQRHLQHRQRIAWRRRVQQKTNESEKLEEAELGSKQIEQSFLETNQPKLEPLPEPKLQPLPQPDPRLQHQQQLQQQQQREQQRRAGAPRSLPTLNEIKEVIRCPLRQKLWIQANCQMKGSLSDSADRKKRKFFEALRDEESDWIKDADEELINCVHDFGWKPLHVAAANGNLKAVKELLDRNADVDARDEFTSAYEMTTRHRASSGDYEWFKEALALLRTREAEFSDKIDSNLTSYRGFSPLHYAVLCNSLPVVAALLERGCDVDAASDAGTTPLEIAKEKDFREIAVLLEAAEKRKKKKEKRKAKDLKSILEKKFVGQSYAIEQVSCAMRRWRFGWWNRQHPFVILFLGPSGVGKTEMAKEVAGFLEEDFGSEFVRLDMSEYQEKHSVSKLIGAPPGYVGHDVASHLTKELKRISKSKKECVVLLDEVEKAHPDVMMVMLQLFDEGRITDSYGETVECKNAIFIMTSNLAASVINDKKADDVFDRQTFRVKENFENKEIRPLLKKHFKRSEFLGRIKEIVFFLPFSVGDIRDIVIRELEFWSTSAAKDHNISVEWEDGLKESLVGTFNPDYGVRSVRAAIEQRVVNEIARAQERGLISEGARVRAGLDRVGRVVISTMDEEKDVETKENGKAKVANA